MSEVFSIKEVTVKANKNGLSEPFWVGGGMVISIITSKEWTPARLSFQHCALEGQEWNDFYNSDGQEISVGIVANTEIRIMPLLNRTGWVRLRSGLSAAPVKQAGARKFKIVIQPL